MKKLITFSLALALSVPLFADSLQIFKCSEDGIPGQTEPELMGFSISANGQYICGTIQQGSGFFTASCISGEVKWKMADESGGELRGVNNNGMAIGYLDDTGVLFSFDNAEVSSFKSPAGFRFVLGEGISNDGSVKVGSLASQSFNTVAAYSVGDGDWLELPYPSDEELGGLKEYLNTFSTAKYVSGDGKVILGCLGSFTLPILWIRNEAGDYVSDFFPARFVKAGEADLKDDSKMLYGLSALYMCMSNNGKYIGLTGQIAGENEGERRMVPVIYNTEDKTLKIYSEIQNIDELGYGLYPHGIADDGTFIGSISELNFNFGAFIMKAGEEQAELYINEFPAFSEKLGVGDQYGFNIPTGISADAKRLLGYFYYSDDYDLSSDAPAYWITYVISLDGSGVDQVDTAVQTGPEAVYAIDGRKLGSMSKGLNIVRDADGSVRKILKK